jgi:hypothetical protein
MKLHSIQYQNTKSNTHGLVKEFAWNDLITLFLVVSPEKKIFKCHATTTNITNVMRQLHKEL